MFFFYFTVQKNTYPGGGTDLERGYGDVRPWRPPFHASPVVHKGPISSKTVSSQDPLLRKFGNFSLYSLNFCPNFSSQAHKFGNFQLTSPQIWKFSVHKTPNLEIFSSQAPPLSEASISSQAPHFGNPGCTPLPAFGNSWFLIFFLFWNFCILKHKKDHVLEVCIKHVTCFICTICILH